jgi:hypothetical protein
MIKLFLPINLRGTIQKIIKQKNLESGRCRQIAAKFLVITVFTKVPITGLAVKINNNKV